MNTKMKAEIIAHELDRLAYLVDPYEYWDVVGGRDELSIYRHVQDILDDLHAMNVEPYIEWLKEIINDPSNDLPMQARAASRLTHLFDWILEKEEQSNA